MTRRRLRVATRASKLARTQTDLVTADLRRRAGRDPLDIELVVVETSGDRRTDVQIWEIGGAGVFVKEVQRAVLEGRADLAVHSAKDLPSAPADGLVIAAIPQRADPGDALVGSTLEGLAPGARVATGSVRRRAQLAWLRPDLTFAGLRGNIETRLAKAPRYDAIVVAAAALERLDLMDAAAEVLDPSILVPQVGQGALAVECRAGDDEVRELLAAVDHVPSRRAVGAERAFLREVGGGCDVPVGAHATIADAGTSTSTSAIRLTGVLATADGRILIRHRDEGEDPDAVGRAVARHLLDSAGGWAIVDEVAGSLEIEPAAAARS